MKMILLIHVILCIATGAIFTSLGMIDKGRLNKASLSHKPELLFAFDKGLVRDGGSIYWDSLIYSAQEYRATRAWKEDGETKIADGFQGVSWTWKYHNLVWIWLIIGGSALGSIVTFHRTRNAEVMDANLPYAPQPPSNATH